MELTSFLVAFCDLQRRQKNNPDFRGGGGNGKQIPDFTINNYEHGLDKFQIKMFFLLRKRALLKGDNIHPNKHDRGQGTKSVINITKLQ